MKLSDRSKVALAPRHTAWLLPAFFLMACGADEAPSESSIRDYVIEGDLPAGMDFAPLLARLSPGGFAVVGDPATGEVATLMSPTSPTSQEANDEFDVIVGADCPDCTDPTCATSLRTITISLLHHSGAVDLLYSVENDFTMNYSAPSTTPRSWFWGSSEDTLDFTTTGTLPSCGPFVHYFNVVACDPGEDDCSISLYTQDFDALPNSGSPEQEDFLAALPGWNTHSSNGNHSVGTGSSNTGAIYSFGASGSTERALGGVASGGTDTQYWGFCYTNSLDHAVEDLTLQYAGEQWRNSGNENAQSLTVDISVAQSVYDGFFDEAFHEEATGVPTTGWAPIAELTFTGPQTGSAGAIDGNADENRDIISATIPGVVLEPDDFFCIRWVDIDDGGSDHGLAIDELELRGVAVPPV
jgi:hypothetical protein